MKIIALFSTPLIPGLAVLPALPARLGPRHAAAGVVGAGVIRLTIEYGIGGPVMGVALRSPVLNQPLTPVFVSGVNHLVGTAPALR